MLRVVRQHALAPGKGIAAVVARAVKELAEIQIEVAQESGHAVHVRQGNAQIAPVLLGPFLETENLAVAQARPQRLAGLQVFVRHGAQRRQPQPHGVQHIARARQLAAGARAQPLHQLTQQPLVPHARKAPARAVIGNLEFLQPIGLELGHLAVQAAVALGQVGARLRVAEVHLIDDGQQRNLEQDGVQPRPLDDDADFLIGQRLERHVLFVEAEDAQEIGKVALDETQRTQIGKLLLRETQRTQMADFLANLLHIRRQPDARVAALEAVLHLRARKLVQHHLHHGELVQIGIEQAFNDHGPSARRGKQGEKRRESLTALPAAALS